MSGFVHIIALVVIAILLFALIAALKIHEKPSVRDTDFIDRFIMKIDEKTSGMNVSLTTIWYLRLMIICPVTLGVIIFALSKNGFFAILCGSAGLYVPEVVLMLQKASFEKKFEDLYARSLEQMSAGLAAGMSINQAIADTANCRFLHESMRQYYARMSAEINMGVPLCVAFTRFAQSTNNQDVKDTALAIEIQDEIGGREAEVIRSIAFNIRQRISMRREIKTLFTDVKVLSIIMDFLPYVCMISFALMSDMTAYTSSPMMTILSIALFITPVIGSVINHRSINKSQKEV